MGVTIKKKLKNIQKQVNKLKDARCYVADVGQDTKTLDAVIIAMARILEYLTEEDHE